MKALHPRLPAMRPALILAALVLTPLFLIAAAAGCSESRGKPGPVPAAGKESPSDALCQHEVARRFCPLCSPEVKNDPNVLLCKEHGDIPEDICTACHPELKAKYRTCAHELPPAFCPACLAAKKDRKE